MNCALKLTVPAHARPSHDPAKTPQKIYKLIFTIKRIKRAAKLAALFLVKNSLMGVIINLK
jgi:hypothetical protein